MEWPVRRTMSFSPFFEEVGLDGCYMDTFVLAQDSLTGYSFDAWDGVTADINLGTGQIGARYTDAALVGAEARKSLINYCLTTGSVIVTNELQADLRGVLRESVEPLRVPVGGRHPADGRVHAPQGLVLLDHPFGLVAELLGQRPVEPVQFFRTLRVLRLVENISHYPIK
jgi:hypothetical protein